MDITAKIADELGIKRHQAEAAIKLIDEGNTIPFIARYRKEATGALNDEILRNLYDRLNYLRNLEENERRPVLASIEEQGKLTEELRSQILAAETMVLVEDLYRPYKPKRRTRATIAKEKGSRAAGRHHYTCSMLNDDRWQQKQRNICDAEKGVDDQSRMRSQERKTSLQRAFPMRQITEATSVNLPMKKGRIDFNRQRPGGRVCL